MVIPTTIPVTSAAWVILSGLSEVSAPTDTVRRASVVGGNVSVFKPRAMDVPVVVTADTDDSVVLAITVVLIAVLGVVVVVDAVVVLVYGQNSVKPVGIFLFLTYVLMPLDGFILPAKHFVFISHETIDVLFDKTATNATHKSSPLQASPQEDRYEMLVTPMPEYATSEHFRLIRMV